MEDGIAFVIVIAVHWISATANLKARSFGDVAHIVSPCAIRSSVTELYNPKRTQYIHAWYRPTDSAERRLELAT